METFDIISDHLWSAYLTNPTAAGLSGLQFRQITRPTCQVPMESTQMNQRLLTCDKQQEATTANPNEEEEEEERL